MTNKPFTLALVLMLMAVCARAQDTSSYAFEYHSVRWSMPCGETYLLSLDGSTIVVEDSSANAFLVVDALNGSVKLRIEGQGFLAISEDGAYVSLCRSIPVPGIENKTIFDTSSVYSTATGQRVLALPPGLRPYKISSLLQRIVVIRDSIDDYYELLNLNDGKKITGVFAASANISFDPVRKQVLIYNRVYDALTGELIPSTFGGANLGGPSSAGFADYNVCAGHRPDGTSAIYLRHRYNTNDEGITLAEGLSIVTPEWTFNADRTKAYIGGYKYNTYAKQSGYVVDLVTKKLSYIMGGRRISDVPYGFVITNGFSINNPCYYSFTNPIKPGGKARYLYCLNLAPRSTGVDDVQPPQTLYKLEQTRETVRVVSATGSIIQSVQVVDVQGKTIQQLDGRGRSEIEFPISALPNGAYFVKIYNQTTQDPFSTQFSILR